MLTKVAKKNISRKTSKEVVSGSRYILERVTWRTRNFAILAFIVTFPWSSETPKSLHILVGACIFYNLLRFFVKIHTLPLVRSPAVMLFIDHVFLAWMLLLTGGIHSPYIFYLTIPVLTASYIRRSAGPMPLVILTSTSITFVLVAAMFPEIPAIHYGPARIAAIFCFTFIMQAFMADQLSESQRSERNYALNIQNQAEAERSRLITLINSMADSVLAVDINGKVTLYNAAALSLLGTHDLLGKSVEDILKLTDEVETPVDIMGIARGSSTIVQRNDLRFITSDESLINLGVSISPVRTSFKGGSQNNSAYIMVLRDITKSKNLEQQRDEFLSVITHELRTPVATAEAGLSILLTPKMTDLSPNAAKYAQIAHDNIVFLAELINDLASISKLEQGSYKIEPEPLDVKRILQDLAKNNRVAAKAKKLRLKIEPHDDLPDILSSEHEVKEILQNFIANSIKYTTSGSITLSVHAVSKPERGIVFAIKDTGIGIAASDKPHLFEKFYRSEDYRTRSAGGTGLGLYITMKLAERLSAKVWFTSKLNHGTTFYLFLPPYSKLEQDKKDIIDAQLNTMVTST